MACKHFEDDSDNHTEDSSKGAARGEPADRPWTGRTVFHELGSLPCEALVTKDPAPWCKICLRSKARGVYHKQQYDRRPLLQADYGCLIDKATRQDILVFACVNDPTGMTSFCVVPPGVTHSLNYDVSGLTGPSQAVLQTVQEASIHGLARAAGPSLLARDAREHRPLPCGTMARGSCATRGSEGTLQRLRRQDLRRAHDLVCQPCHLDLQSLLALRRPDIL